jgi:flavin reductase (DIM6/NTAB) family NADH-FMN oxidoreductase RutF
MDKWNELGLKPMQASRIAAPLVDGCVAWLECRVLPERSVETRYDLFIAEVLAASADDRVCSEGRWHFDADELRTVHYAAGGQYFTTGQLYIGRTK